MSQDLEPLTKMAHFRTSPIILRGLISATIGISLTLLLIAPSGAAPYLRPGRASLITVSTSGDQASYPSSDSEGTAACQPQAAPGISDTDLTPDGRFVAFSSNATNLVDNDNNNGCDIFVRDMRKGTTQRVSVSSAGTEANIERPLMDEFNPPQDIASAFPSISDDGRYVAFVSSADNLVTERNGRPYKDTNLKADIFVHDRKKGETELVSVGVTDSDLPETPLPDMEGNASDRSGAPAISGDGRFIAYMSAASNLTQEDDPHPTTFDIFVLDTLLDTTAIASTPSPDEELPPFFGFGGHTNEYPSISATGRFVKFQSSGPLIAADTNAAEDVYVWDAQQAKHELVSVAADGSVSHSGSPSHSTTMIHVSTANAISADGRFVVFQSFDPSHVPNDRNEEMDVFVYDRQARRTERVSVTNSGEEARGSQLASISPDGRFVSFMSWAHNLFEEQSGETETLAGTISDQDVYVHDRRTGGLDWVSISHDGNETSCPGTDGNIHTKAGPLSTRGASTIFNTCAEDVIPGDTNRAWDSFLWERGAQVQSSLEGGRYVPSGRDGSPREFVSQPDQFGDATVDLLGSDLIHGRLAYREGSSDLHVRLELEQMSKLTGQVSPLMYGLELRTATNTFELRASAAPIDGPNSPLFGLFRCHRGECSKVSDIAGGYGTTGEAITISLPIAVLDLGPDEHVAEAVAYSAIGTMRSGPIQILDRLRF